MRSLEGKRGFMVDLREYFDEVLTKETLPYIKNQDIEVVSIVERHLEDQRQQVFFH
jgi:intein/homing endonuclease